MDAKLAGLLDQEQRIYKAISDRIGELYPVGSTVECTVGRYTFPAEVLEIVNDSSGYYVGSIKVRNLTTGKVRRVWATCGDVRRRSEAAKGEGT